MAFIDGNDGENFMTEGLIELWDLLDDKPRKEDKMKKILAILLMLAALLASCGESKSEPTKGLYDIYVDTVRGHEYIIYSGAYQGNIVHSESCPCKKGGDDE